MKRLLLILVIFAGSFAANAQTKDESLVNKAVEKLRLAMISGNKADLQNIAANDLTYAHSSGLVQNKAEFVSDIATKKNVFLTIELTNQTTNVSGDIAIVSQRLSAETFDGGKPGAANLNIVLVWRKVKGEWKLLARRAFKVLPA